MAAMFEAMKNKLSGRTYHHNLLGLSLADLMRQATAKTLLEPDEETNQMVVDTIHQEVSAGKPVHEIVNLLKKRLQMDNPQKQWLGIILVGLVMQTCQNELAAFQDELLTEVAHVFARPAKPDSEQGRKAKAAAKELLRTYGRGGAMAFRNANQAYRQQLPPAVGTPTMGGRATFGGEYSGATAGAQGGSQQWPPATAAAQRGPGTPVAAGAAGGADAEMAGAVRDSVLDEVRRLIEQAKVNTELLGEMLVNTTPTTDEFDLEIMHDLVNEVRELRTLLGTYIEQIGTLGGPESEVLMCQALEATDMLDSALALEKDVGQNLREANSHPALMTNTAAGNNLMYGSGGGAGPSRAAAPYMSSPAPPPPPRAPQNDLIALDDLADAMTATTVRGGGGGYHPSGGAPAAAYDPFAASNFGASADPWQRYPQQPQSHQQQPPEGHALAFPPSDFDRMQGQAPAYGSTAQPPPFASSQPLNDFPPSGAFPPSTFHSSPPHQQQQQQPPLQQQQQYGSSQAAAHQAPQQPYHQSPPQQQQYGSTSQAPPPHFAADQAGFAALNQFGNAAPQQSTSSSPFNAPAPYSQPPAFASSNPFANMAPAAVPVSNNPFASSSAAPTHPPAATASAGGKPAANAIDVEWDLFFADRAAGTQPK